MSGSAAGLGSLGAATPARRSATRMMMWPGQDSNLRATDYESAALTN